MDKPREECGVLGLWSEEPLDVAGLLHLGLLALQHRGQEAAGIAVSDGKEFWVEKDLGLVNQVFTEERLARLRLWGGGFADPGDFRSAVAWAAAAPGHPPGDGGAPK